MLILVSKFFFFQAEDGIRDVAVTGVQTCALPIFAILRGEAEVALSQQGRSPEEYRESLGVLHQEAERLTHIVEDLFTLSRADAGQYPLQFRDLYLDELIAECVHSARTLALAKNISLNFDEASESPIQADESLLRRMIL